MPKLTTYLLAVVALVANHVAKAGDEEQCAALAARSYEKAADYPAVIIKSEYVETAEKSLAYQYMFGKRSIVQGMNVGETVKALPPHCRVEGYVAPATRFLALLPIQKNWNSRVLYGACDAFCGAVDEDMPVPGLLNGFASIATDGGHVNKRPFDGTWGYRNREGEKAFGYLASHHAAQIIKALAKDFYGKAHTYAYITGFSKGGLAGLKSALMFPEDFDGVLARAPVVRYQEINAIRLPYISRVNSRADGTSILLAGDIKLIHDAVIQACDEVDGLKDGMIDDPRDCDFEPAALLCRSGGSACLSQEKIKVLEKFYAPPSNDDGDSSYPYPLEFGSELDWPGFHAPGTAESEPFAGAIGRTFLRYLAFEDDPGASYDWREFDPVASGHQLEAMKPMWDATDPDLRAFKANGGKMIVIHGWSDGAVSARMSVDWFNSVQAYLGDSSSFLQLYVVPGNLHGGAPGDGPNINDSLNALIAWVEKGEKPAQLIFHKEDDQGNRTYARPFYPWPTKSVYKGSGDPASPSSYQAQ